jgi:hypothetical protein
MTIQSERQSDLDKVAREYTQAAARIVESLDRTDSEISLGLVRLIERARREHGADSLPAKAVARVAAKVLPIDVTPQPDWLATVDADLRRSLARSIMWVRVFTLRHEGRFDEANEEELTIRLDQAARMVRGLDP